MGVFYSPERAREGKILVFYKKKTVTCNVIISLWRFHYTPKVCTPGAGGKHTRSTYTEAHVRMKSTIWFCWLQKNRVGCSYASSSIASSQSDPTLINAPCVGGYS